MTTFRNFEIIAPDLLAKALERRERYQTAINAHRAFAREHGFAQYKCDLDGHPSAFSNPARDAAGQVVLAKGWRQGRTGIVPDMRTKQGQTFHAAMKALPLMPVNNPLFGDNEPGKWIGWTGDYRYKTDQASGFEVIGSAQMTWYGERYFIVIPITNQFGPSDAAKAFARDFPVPDGCEERTEGEYELMVAQHKVEQEKKKAAA